MSSAESAYITFVCTPGEKVQNWFASRGIGEAVRVRDVEMPEPPAGPWIFINGAIAVTAIAGLVGMVGVAIFQVLPALLLH